MIDKLHFITQSIDGKSHRELAEEACIAGVKWVQLRMKDVSHVEYLKEAQKTKSICEKYGAKLIINDNVEVAKTIGVDGVHLGKLDMDPAEARKILGDDIIIGGTSNTLEDILELHQKGVDYVGLGPFRFTTTKQNLSPVLGVEGYKNIIKSLCEKGISTPVIAIGGIEIKDIDTIMQTGVHGVAIASQINKADDKAGVVEKILNALNYGEITNS